MPRESLKDHKGAGDTSSPDQRKRVPAESGPEKPKQPEKVELKKLSVELQKIGVTVTSAEFMISALEADIAEMQAAGEEDTNEERKQLTEFRNELREARAKQAALQTELKALSVPLEAAPVESAPPQVLPSAIDLLGSQLNKAYEDGNEADIARLESVMLEEYAKTPLQMSEETARSEKERTVSPEVKALKEVQHITQNLEETRRSIREKQASRGDLEDEIRELDGAVRRAKATLAQGRTDDKTELIAKELDLQQAKQRLQALDKEVAFGRDVLAAEEQRGIELSMKNEKALSMLAETAVAQAKAHFEALAAKPKDAALWLEKTYIPEQLEKQHVLPTLADLEREFERRKAIHSPDGSYTEYNEKVFQRELKAELDLDKYGHGQSEFKYRNANYGKPFFNAENGLFAKDIVTGIYGRDRSDTNVRQEFFEGRAKYLDQVLRLFASSDVAVGKRFFNGYNLSARDAQDLARQKAALSEKAQGALFSAWGTTGEFPKEYVFKQIVQEEVQQAGYELYRQVGRFAEIAEQEKKLGEQTPKNPDFNALASALERDQLMQEKQIQLRQRIKNVEYDAGKPFMRMQEEVKAEASDETSVLDGRRSRLSQEKLTAQQRVQTSERSGRIPDATDWTLNRLIAERTSTEEKNKRHYERVMQAKIEDSFVRESLERQGVKVDYTLMQAAAGEYVKPLQGEIDRLDKAILALGKKPEVTFFSLKSTSALKEELKKWEDTYFHLNRQRTVVQNILTQLNSDRKIILEDLKTDTESAERKNTEIHALQERLALAQRQVEAKRAEDEKEVSLARQRLPQIDGELAVLSEAYAKVEAKKNAELTRITKEREQAEAAAKNAYLDQQDADRSITNYKPLDVRAERETIAKQVGEMVSILNKQETPQNPKDLSETVIFSERLARAREVKKAARAEALSLSKAVNALLEETGSNRSYTNTSTAERVTSALNSVGQERLPRVLRQLARG